MSVPSSLHKATSHGSHHSNGTGVLTGRVRKQTHPGGRHVRQAALHQPRAASSRDLNLLTPYLPLSASGIVRKSICVCVCVFIHIICVCVCMCV